MPDPATLTTLPAAPLKHSVFKDFTTVEDVDKYNDMINKRYVPNPKTKRWPDDTFLVPESVHPQFKGGSSTDLQTIYHPETQEVLGTGFRYLAEFVVNEIQEVKTEDKKTGEKKKKEILKRSFYRLARDFDRENMEAD